MNARVDGPRGDDHWMRRALTLARRYAGRTWPNPTVGACLVRDGQPLAEAAHLGAGRPHAEAAVLQAARERGLDARGSTLYVTLEPCHHQGRTPPCSRAIVDAGVERVVYAVSDRTPRHPGGGARWLADRGLRVEGGRFAAEAWELNHPFFETRSDDEVHLTLKLALSLDGRLAPRAGSLSPEARRITGAAAHRRVHRMRAGARAVLVGRGTAEADRPRLDVRFLAPERWEGPPPRPVVLDPRLSLDPALLPPRTVLLHAAGWVGSDAHLRAGLELLPVEADPGGGLRWPGVLDRLRELALGVVLVEGGAGVARSLLEAELPHRVHLFLAPRLIGGDGPTLTVGAPFERSYRTLRTRPVGDDVEWVLRRRSLERPVP